MLAMLQNSAFVANLKKQARENGTPLYGAFELTGRCNLNCKMCYVHVMDQKAALKNELSTQQWKNIMDDACEAGMLFALLTGGECTIRPDFKELYLHLYNKGVVMSVNTNGVLINEEMADFFAAHRPEWIQISLYGSDNTAYERVTEKAEFARVSKAIDLLKERGITVRIAVTMSKYMQPDFENVIRYILDKKLPYQIGDVLIPRRDEAGHDDCSLTAEELAALFKKERTLRNRKPIEVHDIPAPGGEGTEPKYGMPCNAGTIRFVASWDGRMYPCMSIPEVNADLLTTSFSECWEKIRKTMAATVQPVECDGCKYAKKCTFCPALRYNGLNSGHCRKEICDLTVMKYAEGLFRI